jgi:nicotinamidase-related amidase
MSEPEARGTEPEARGAAGSSHAPPWLAVIDMQRVFGERASEWFTPRFGEIVYGIGQLVEAFRPRVTFTRFVAPAVPTGTWRRYYDQWPFALQPPDAEIYQLVDSFAGEAGALLDATTFSKWGPELAASVGEGGRLVLAGVSTDCCVLSTAVAAADAGVQVQVVADACAGVTDRSHAQALDILRLYGPLVEVVSLADVLGPAYPGDGPAELSEDPAPGPAELGDGPAR